MSLETMTKLATTTVGAGGVASVTFSNIPQTYTNLVVKVSARSSTNNTYDDLQAKFNGVSLSYTNKNISGPGNGIAVGSGSNAYTTSGLIGSVPALTATASTFGNTEIYIPNYTSANFKAFSCDVVDERNVTTGVFSSLNANLWSDNAAITSIQLLAAGGDFVQHSTFHLYGVKAMRTAAGNSIKATGGAISFDGTYVTHTFNTTGSFTPTTNLLVDYLVVAGGGGGGNYASGNGGGGGGGAGGYRTSIGSTPLSLTTTSYTVTLGAGGAINTSGSTSSFSTIFSSGGGYGGNNGTPFAGASGGSGGGSIRSDSGITVAGGAGNAGSYSPVEGYAGGSGSGPGGGGGGAGAVGSNSSSGGGTGGIGAVNSISGTTKYYAGGGGGAGSTGNAYGAGAGGLGGGGQGGGLNMIPVAGTVNTGGGGGGQQFYPNTTTGGAGGSGIVIIRYKG